MSGEMINLKNLALGAMDVNNVLEMPSMADTQARNEQYRLGRIARENAAEASWNQSEAQDGIQGYRPSPMNGYKPLYADFDGSVFTPSTEPTENLGGMGGNLRAPTNMVTANTEGNNSTAPTEGGVSKQEADRIEKEVDAAFSIPALLQKLQELGTLQPGDERDPLFQLDTMYKGTDPTQGIPGTQAQQPTARQPIMMGTNLGNMGGNY